ncbi:MAG: YraN family protein [Roseivivax sp.]
MSADVSVARDGGARGRDARAQAGAVAYHAGLAAEAAVAADYHRRGYALAATRWRGRGGELDLVLRDGDGVIFVEVKKSRSFDRAAESLTPRQAARIMRTAEEFLGGEPRGSLTEARVDVALVNAHGEMRVIENALMG